MLHYIPLCKAHKTVTTVLQISHMLEIISDHAYSLSLSQRDCLSRGKIVSTTENV